MLSSALMVCFSSRVLKMLSCLSKPLTVLLLVVLSACVTNPGSIYVSTPPAAPAQESKPIVIDRSVVGDNTLPLPDEPEIAAYSLPKPRPVSPVVGNLIKKSQEQSGQDDFDGAANSLERALRIEPRNAMLWNRLADIRYLQKSWKKSIQLAAKSNTLAGNDRELRRENWYLMSNSYKALGNEPEEQRYREKLIQQGY